MTFSETNGAGSTETGHVLPGLAQGRAAVLLTESLMHALVHKGVISKEEFIEIVEGAAEVEAELISSREGYPADRGGALLPTLATALKRELGR